MKENIEEQKTKCPVSRRRTEAFVWSLVFISCFLVFSYGHWFVDERDRGIFNVVIMPLASLIGLISFVSTVIYWLSSLFEKRGNKNLLGTEENTKENTSEQKLQRLPSRHGVTSFAWSLVMVALFFGIGVIAILSAPDKADSAPLIVVFLFFAIVVSFVATVVYGIASLFQKGSSRIYGVVGLSIALLLFGVVILVYLFRSHIAA